MLIIQFFDFGKHLLFKRCANVQNLFMVFCFDAVVKIQMRNIGTDQNEVTALKIGDMPPNMALSVGSFNIDQFKLGMKMPKKEIVQLGVVQ